MTTPTAPGSPRAGARVARGRVVLLVLLGAGLVLVSSALVWVTGRAPDAPTGGVTSMTGAEVVRALVPLGLAAGAGGLALTLVDGWARRVVAAVVILCGIALVWLGVSAWITPPGAGVVPGTATPDPAHAAGSVVSPIGPALATVGASGVTASGLAALLVGDRWPRRGPRQAPGPSAARGRSEWDRLSDGDDPT